MTVTVSTGDGCRIAWRFDGPADAPILLLSNSLGTTMRMWEPQMPSFAARMRVLRYDARGHGASDSPVGGYSIDRLGRDVIELLDALDVARVSFCGLSLGGMVGQWLAVRARDRIDRLVLANTSAFMGPPSGWDGRIDAVRASGMAPLVEPSLERWFTSSFRAQGGVALDGARRMLMAADPVGYAGCCAAIRDMDLRPTMAGITTRTLVIGGSADPATPPVHSRTLVEGIAGARLRMLPAAHLSNVECPAAFSDAVLSFCDAAPAG